MEITKFDTVLYFNRATFSNMGYLTEDKDGNITSTYNLCGDSNEYEGCILTKESDTLIKCVLKNNSKLNCYHTLFIVKVEQLSVLLTTCEETFNCCNYITDITNLKIPSHITNCHNMFAYCSINSLEGVKLPKKLVNMFGMFFGNNIESIDGLKIPKRVIHMTDTFGENPIKTINDFKIPKNVKYCNNIFIACKKLTDVSGLKISKHVERYTGMFCGCSSLDTDTLMVSPYIRCKKLGLKS